MAGIKSREEVATLVKKVQPSGIREMLEPKMNSAGNKTWRDFQNNSNKVLEELIGLGVIVKPDLKLPAGWHQYSYEKGGLFPAPPEYAGLEQPYRDSWKRFMDAVLELKPEQVLYISEENNLWPFIPRRRLSKRHNLVSAPRFDSLDRVDKLSVHALAVRLGETRIGDIFVGMDFQGVQHTGREYRVFHISDIFRGQLMDEVLPRRIGDDWLGEVAFYADSPDIWSMGLEALVKNIPSLGSPGDAVDVELHHVPLVHVSQLKKGIVTVDPSARAISYNFRATDPCEKRKWMIKYGRGQVFGKSDRKGDELWLDHHVVFAYSRMRRFADWLREGEADPGRRFVILPMFPSPAKEETKEGFRKMYGTKTEEGVIGGVVVDARLPVGQFGHRLDRHSLSERLVDLDIALHNLVAVTADSMRPEGHRIVYSKSAKALPV